MKRIVYVVFLFGAFMVCNSCHKSKISNTWIFNGSKTFPYSIPETYYFISGTDTEYSVVYDSTIDSTISITNLSMQITSDGGGLVVKNLIDSDYSYYLTSNVPANFLLTKYTNNASYYLDQQGPNTGLGISVELSISGDTAALTYDWLVNVGPNSDVAIISLHGTRQ